MPMFNESPTLNILLVFSLHTLVLDLKIKCTLKICGIKPQWYKVAHFVYKRYEPMKIYKSVFNNVIFIYTLWL
jgi:hypothetical protein